MESNWDIMSPVFNRSKLIMLNDSELNYELNVPVCRKKLTCAVIASFQECLKGELHYKQQTFFIFTAGSGEESTVSLKHIAFYVCVVAFDYAFPLLAWNYMVMLFLQAGLMHHGSLFEFACAHACA